MTNELSFLRRVLLADGVVSGTTGLLLALGAGFLGNLLNLPEILLRNAGVFLILYGALVGYLGMQTRPATPAVWTVIAANTLWVLNSILILVLGWVQPSELGYAFVIFQAVVVALFAELEYMGLRRIRLKAVRVQG